MPSPHKTLAPGALPPHPPPIRHGTAAARPAIGNAEIASILRLRRRQLDDRAGPPTGPAAVHRPPQPACPRRQRATMAAPQPGVHGLAGLPARCRSATSALNTRTSARCQGHGACFSFRSMPRPQFSKPVMMTIAASPALPVRSIMSLNAKSDAGASHQRRPPGVGRAVVHRLVRGQRCS